MTDDSEKRRKRLEALRQRMRESGGNPGSEPPAAGFDDDSPRARIRRRIAQMRSEGGAPSGGAEQFPKLRELLRQGRGRGGGAGLRRGGPQSADGLADIVADLEDRFDKIESRLAALEDTLARTREDREQIRDLERRLRGLEGGEPSAPDKRAEGKSRAAAPKPATGAKPGTAKSTPAAGASAAHRVGKRTKGAVAAEPAMKTNPAPEPSAGTKPTAAKSTAGATDRDTSAASTRPAQPKQPAAGTRTPKAKEKPAQPKQPSAAKKTTKAKAQATGKKTARKS